MRRPLAALALGCLLAACGVGTDTAGTQPTPGLQGEIVASEVVVGDQRLPLGILEQNTPVNDATVHVRAFYLGAASGSQMRGQADAPFKGEGLEGKGVYVARLKFDIAGSWLAEITAQRAADGAHAVIHLPFNVVANPVVPAVGQPAPRSHNPTAKDVSDVSTIDSGTPPDDMHQISIADAIAQQRPTLVIFATPAFCQTATCGPEVKVVQSLEPAYQGRLAFIHVEIYRDYKPDPTKRQFAQTVLDWRLQTEPWIFLIDSKGIIRARFEGPTATDEVKAAIDQLLATP
ncbi:MAG: thioredoxin family protein [Chloroflexi bacterium]|nr:MAG: thioredoxin family protein [Chloroflexota bacterium]TMG37688.1 MAG: thioredoxin family protein [Chloroflexota bacterium]